VSRPRRSGLDDFAAQIVQPGVEPGIGLTRGLELGLKLFEQIVLREGVGDPGRLCRVGRGEADAHDIGQADTPDDEARANRVHDALSLSLGFDFGQSGPGRVRRRGREHRADAAGDLVDKAG
jgi:hypothetical protein